MNGKPQKIAALIVAAGRGTRAGDSDLPKQYRLLGETSVLTHAIRAFSENQRITDLLVVIHPDDEAAYVDATESFPELPEPVMGGDTRQESVLNGLERLESNQPDIVLIHDAARPFVTPALIDEVIDAVNDRGGAVPALAIAETLKRGSEGLITETVSRDGLYAVQTPQGFPFRPLLEAHRAAFLRTDALTDDAAVFEEAGGSVYLVEGSRDNIKLTTKSDFTYAETSILPLRQKKNLETRVGQGFDVHAFGPGYKVVLGGVTIPHERSLVGHSDADVALHALTDAILGAIGEGDIGTHYPPSDPKWKGANSSLFLQESAKKVTDNGGRIVHLDLTIICEAPKIGPHREAMKEAIAEIVDLEPSRISVKATTSERLGFAGRREGIAAMALATVVGPASQ